MVSPYAGKKAFCQRERMAPSILIPVTNAIEALNSKLRRAVRARGHFPTDEAALKLLFLVLNRSEKEWIMPPREWSLAKAQFSVLFGEHFKRAAA
jgi:putative transposase